MMNAGCAAQALDLAIEQEDYSTASLVRDNAGLQYRGWWYGTSSAHNEPHLLRVESCFGRMAGFRLSISDIVTVEVCCLILDQWQHRVEHGS